MNHDKLSPPSVLPFSREQGRTLDTDHALAEGPRAQELQGLYPVNDCYVSVQGEGVMAGTPMVVLRLQGCPVGCPFCDTKQTWERKPGDFHEPPTEAASRLAATAILYPWLGESPMWSVLGSDQIRFLVDRVATEAGLADFTRPRWVLLTGGEPALNDLRLLAAELRNPPNRWSLAIETSGTAQGHVLAHFDHVTVSPKPNMPGGRALNAAALASADELKFVIGRDQDLQTALDVLEMMPPTWNDTITVQPMAPANGVPSEKAVQRCVSAAIRFGWRVSMQQHKYLGLR